MQQKDAFTSHSISHSPLTPDSDALRVESLAHTVLATTTEKSGTQDVKGSSVSKKGMRAFICIFIFAAGVTAYLLLLPSVGVVVRSRPALICSILCTSATILWSLSLIPLTATSLALLPPLVYFQVLAPREPMLESLKCVIQLCTSKIVLLLLGSCMLSAYFEAHGGRSLLLPYLSHTAGPGGIFRLMILSALLSSVMSNITAPIIITSVLQGSGQPLSASAVLGIAMASNIGGMLLPISSPQSVLGAFYMGIGWGRWVFVSLPTTAACFVVVYAVVYLLLSPKSISTSVPDKLLTDKAAPETPAPGSHEQSASTTWALGMSGFAVCCWLLSSLLPFARTLCALPVLALLLAAGLRANMSWKTFEILSIAVSGLALGKGIEATGVLEDVIQSVLDRNAQHSVFFLLIASSLVMLVASCLVCHTVSAVVLLPIFQRMGSAIQKEKLLLATASLVCSCGMALPTSGFPNILASSLRDEKGKRLVPIQTFASVGVLSTVCCWACILTVGLALMGVLGY